MPQRVQDIAANNCRKTDKGTTQIFTGHS